jgi:hypothetical protein
LGKKFGMCSTSPKTKYADANSGFRECICVYIYNEIHKNVILNLVSLGPLDYVRIFILVILFHFFYVLFFFFLLSSQSHT